MFKALPLFIAIVAFGRTTVIGKSFGVENPETPKFSNSSSSDKASGTFQLKDTSSQMAVTANDTWPLFPEYESIDDVAPLLSGVNESNEISVEASTEPESVIKNNSLSEVVKASSEAVAAAAADSGESRQATREIPKSAESSEEEGEEEEDSLGEKSSECQGLTQGQFLELKNICDECFDLVRRPEVYTLCRLR